MNKEQAQKLLKAGTAMRDAQNRYFKTRRQDDLRCCKDFERRFDALLQECSEGEQPKQYGLLTQNP